MSWSRVAPAAVAACAFVFAAGQAGAVTTLVFEITSGNPALGTFQQTWTLQDGTGVTNTLNAPTILYGYVGDATASATAVTSDLLTQTHVTSYDQASFDFTRGVDETDATDGSIGFSLSQFGGATFDASGTGSAARYSTSDYSVSIFASSCCFAVPSGEPTVADLIAYASDPTVDLIWNEHADASRFKTRGDVYLGDLFNIDYFGSAKLISVDGRSLGAAPAPEPAAWALMILGFGAAGSALRRRAVRAA
jgi:hypothetical protein